MPEEGLEVAAGGRGRGVVDGLAVEAVADVVVG